MSVIALKLMRGVLLPEIAWLARISLRNALWHHTNTSTCLNCLQYPKLTMTRWCSCALCQHGYCISAETFPRRWTGSGGRKQWSPRSPKLTPLDFYFWGHVKQIVYSVRIRNIQHLKQRTSEAAASVSPDVLGRVWQEMEYHLDVCRDTNGAHTELR
jgi:hypothetical protein